MFLKSVELFGFKSFADRTRFEFTDGITSLLGPNGSGKSNVVDSIKWVLGTQSLNAIRAGKKEDVIFNGTDTRKPMPMCEVILTLSNEKNILNIEAAEVQIKRRMQRNGDNEYFINGERALLRNVKDLFMDTGVGKAAYSILEQGKIDQILSLKPEDRRYIFEEAAGISRFKVQSEEAARKLEKTDANMAQAEILFREEEKKYNSRKIQMERLIKSRELKAKEEEIEIELQLSTVQSLSKYKGVLTQRLDEKTAEYNELNELLKDKKSNQEKQNAELEELRRKREEVTISVHRTEEQKNSTFRELEILNERYHDIHQRINAAKYKAEQVQQKLERDRVNYEGRCSELAEIKENIQITHASMNTLKTEIDQIISEREKSGLEIEEIEKKSDLLAEERNEITKRISDLANDITQKLEENIKGSGYSSSLRTNSEKNFFNELAKAKKILLERLDLLKNIVQKDFDKNAFINALEETDEDLRTELDEIKGLFQEYSGTIPTFLDEFASPSGILSQKAQLDSQYSNSFEKEKEYSKLISDLKNRILTLGNSLILKKSDLEDLEKDEIQFKTKAESLQAVISDMKETLKQSENDASDVIHSIEMEETVEADVVEKINIIKANQASYDDKIRELKDLSLSYENQISEKTLEITKNNKEQQQQFDRLNTLIAEISTEKANIQNVEEMVQKTFTDFFDNTGKSLREFNDHEITASVEDLKTEMAEVKKKIDSLGYINFMAEEEFNEAQKNYEFYKKNLDDLIQAKRDLEEVIWQIKEKSEQMFIETYDQISVAFEEMFTTLFSGGHAKLSLSDPENVLTSGIEILAQPPGKTLVHLPLLSGGEKSMTAVALLFATYKVKPSPFCILDEIDAALDDRNIGAFLQVLRQFDDESQFIIITHNKHTVMGSNSLLGITQQELGVSKMIGYKLDEAEDLTNTQVKLK